MKHQVYFDPEPGEECCAFYPGERVRLGAGVVRKEFAGRTGTVTRRSHKNNTVRVALDGEEKIIYDARPENLRAIVG